MCDDFVDAPPPRDSPNIKSFAGNFEQLPVARQLDLSQRKDRAGRQGDVRCRRMSHCALEIVYTLAATLSMISRSFEESAAF